MAPAGRSQGETAPCIGPGSWGRRDAPACSCVTPLSASLSPCLSQVSLCLSLVRTLVVGHRVHAMSWTISFASLNLPTSAKTTFPVKVTPTGAGDIPFWRTAIHPLCTVLERGPESGQNGAEPGKEDSTYGRFYLVGPLMLHRQGGRGTAEGSFPG